MLMRRRIFFEIRLRQLEQRGGRAQPVFLQMHEGACELDESFVKISVRAVLVRQPQIFEHVVRFVKKLAIEAIKITKIMRVESPTLKGFDHDGDARAFVAHGLSLKRKSRGDETHSEKEIGDSSRRLLHFLLRN